MTGDWREKYNDCWERDIKKKIVTEKPFDPGRVLGKKPTTYDWGLKGRRSWNFQS